MVQINGSLMFGDKDKIYGKLGDNITACLCLSPIEDAHILITRMIVTGAFLNMHDEFVI